MKKPTNELWVDLLSTPIPDLERAVTLLKEREVLLKRLNEIGAVLEPSSVVASSKVPSPFRDEVVDELRRKGKPMSVAELAKSLGRKAKDLHSWFSDTGKKSGLFVKAAPGVWGLA